LKKRSDKLSERKVERNKMCSDPNKCIVSKYEKSLKKKKEGEKRGEVLLIRISI